MNEMLKRVKELRQDVIDYSVSMESIISKFDITDDKELDVCIRATVVMGEKLEQIAEYKKEFKKRLDFEQRV